MSNKGQIDTKTSYFTHNTTNGIRSNGIRSKSLDNSLEPDRKLVGKITYSSLLLSITDMSSVGVNKRKGFREQIKKI